MTGRSRGQTNRRGLHPAAWWAWAACLAIVASRTTDVLLLLLVVVVAAYVVAARRTDAPWSRSLAVFLKVGLVVIAVRVILEMAFGNRLPGHVLFTLPQVPLPAWAQGVSIGGPVTAEALVQAAVEGLRLAVVLVCFGAANSLASPYRLLRCLPAVLYEAGVAITVSLAFVPELVASIGEVRDARRLRGRPVRGLSGVRGLAIPVLERALDRSVQLASSMDARGYGRQPPTLARARRWAAAAVGVGLLAVLAGVYGLLAAGSLPAAGLPLVAVGCVVLAGGLIAGSRRRMRTRYRPDPWGMPEWAVVASGLAAVIGVVVAGILDPGSLQMSLSPLRVPTLPLVAMVGVVLAVLPAWVAPVEMQTRAMADTDGEAGQPRTQSTSSQQSEPGTPVPSDKPNTENADTTRPGSQTPPPPRDGACEPKRVPVGPTAPIGSEAAA